MWLSALTKKEDNYQQNQRLFSIEHKLHWNKDQGMIHHNAIILLVKEHKNYVVDMLFLATKVDFEFLQ